MMAAPTDIQISHADRVLFPDGTTKGELTDYYSKIAPTVLPHLTDRPLMLQRFPRGVEHGGFFQKDVTGQLPEWIETVPVDKEGGSVCHVLCNDRATLTYLANQDCVTLHTWLSRADRLRNPDRMVFDLDPDSDDNNALRAAVRQLKDLLDELGLTSYLQTTGSRGFHVVVPLDRGDDVGRVREFARAVADTLAQRHPKELTTEARKSARGGRIYLDVTRNAYAQTAVSPYSVRGLEDAPVATPLRWPDLDDPRVSPRRYSIHTMMRRLGQTSDPWADIDAAGQALREATRRVERMQN